MRSLDLCPACHTGRLKTQSTRASGDRRIRYLKCEFCGETGTEIIEGAARPRPKRNKSSNLEGSCPCSGQVLPKNSRPSAIISLGSQYATAAGASEKERMMLKDIFQVSKELNIHWQECRDWLEFGYMPAPIIVGGRLRFSQVDLNNWVAAGYPQSAELSEEQCSPFWDALLDELQEADERKGICR